MNRRSAALLALLAPLAAPAGAASFECRDGLRVVGFPDALVLSVGDSEVALSSGSLGYAIPGDSSARVREGEALMLVDGVRVSADEGDALSFFCAGGAAEIQVHEGAVEIKSPEGIVRTLEAGEFIVLPPLAFPAPAVPELRPEPTRQSFISFVPLRFLLETHPYYQFLQSYQTNIYRVPDDRPDGRRVAGGVLSSWVTTHNPGLAAKVIFDRSNWLDAVYDLKVRRYTQQPDINNDLEQAVHFAYNRQSLRLAKFKVWDTYLNTSNPPTEELTGREKRFQNTIGTEVEIAYGRRNLLGFFGNHTSHKFLNPTLGAQLNRYEQTAGARVGQVLQSRLRLFLEYARQIVHYSSRSANSKSHLVDVALDGKFTPKLSGTARAGLGIREYDSGTGERYLRMNLQALYQPQSRTRINLAAFRNVEEARFQGARFYISTGANVSVSRVVRKLTLSVNARYQRDAYSEETTLDGVRGKRRDAYYVFGGGVGYPITQWLSAAASYSNTRRQSLFSGLFDYKDEQTTFGFKAQF